MDYNVLYEKFLNLGGFNYSELPSCDELRYQLINDAVDLYNQRTRKYKDRLKWNITYDNDKEVINELLSSDEKLILVYCMCYITATKSLSEFVSTWSVVANETGIKDYKAQVTARNDNIQMFDNQVTKIIEDSIDSFM